MIEFNRDLSKEGFTWNRQALIKTLNSFCVIEKKNLKLISYVFLSDEELLELNKEYLQHDYFTDIITFDYSESENEIDGECFISIDRVLENQKVYGDDELIRVIGHGLLHLMGYNDQNEKEVKEIRRKEDEFIKMFHVEL